MTWAEPPSHNAQDLLDDALVERYRLSTIREVYVDSIFTPQELLKRIKVLYGKGVATSLLKELERRVRRDYGGCGQRKKEAIVAELQGAANDFESAKALHGGQVQVRPLPSFQRVRFPNRLSPQDYRDQAVFDLQHLLNNVFGGDEKGVSPFLLPASGSATLS